MNSTKVKKVLYDIFIKYQGLLVILVLIDQLTKIWALNSLDTPFEHLIKGFEYHINHKTLTIKDNTTLQKEFKKFKEGV